MNSPLSYLLSSKKKRRAIVLPIGLLLVLLLALALVGKGTAKPKLGLLEVQGVIMDSKNLLAKIKELEQDPEVLGVLLRVNSPGGVVAPSQEIYEAVKRLGSKKPVYASLGAVAASGGYYVSLGAKKIYASPGSLTGSIGVILQSLNASELLEKIGLKMEVIKSGAHKDEGSPFRAMEPEERKLLETVIMDTHEQFVAVVASNRPINQEKLAKIADGRIFTGRQAQALGLIDEVGGIEEAISALKATLDLKGEVELVEPHDLEQNFLSNLKLESWTRLATKLQFGGLMFMDSRLVNP
ncbi:MAG: hypothetical protein A2600_01245 [Candidatus Lambdaproteobacteria bacterium RIFOXYD1_FULL_56_27]|uniref:Peptidase S49 domain-containing protein n=1 Tax=Candidatus Lambdaproteobacteria bacterium RIFOXYD2_FULL_56_26 TaxID=1817773 RepID=A0A1F6GS90_9PROT|nr:MAG: hypothetical protein A2557_00360 [Candidatus Lambdaproteobacteria bacterium RIFOXYD2_FULL_56_26]OGH01360.1 MAG: hypothetical protein A2426_13195 [Candidatus Lambdaproteobacteria bacterium RIFOXYC1_FULL_56_13]OGH06901.1 MAG: hypothetical protein A2600_01245 [Candidatus Lambdaproteobacteria bacterium RIFOXYD1_FULL_56_27]